MTGSFQGAWVAAAVGAVLAGAACVGNIGDGDGSGPGSNTQGPGEQCEAELEAHPGRLLTAAQYNNAIQDLLGVNDLAAPFEHSDGLITKLMVRQLRDGAASAVARRDEWTKEVFPCDTRGAEDISCVDAFIDTFGKKVFRRPLTDAERDHLKATYVAASADLSFEDSLETVLEVMLQSPAFAYLFEDGVDEATGHVRLLSDYEVASRLAFFLINSTPDDELLAAADAGALSTVEGLTSELDRLLETPAARRGVVAIVRNMMQIDGGDQRDALLDVMKDGALYPEADDALLTAMRTETDALIERTIFDGTGNFADLWTSRDAYVNGPLATLYGVSSSNDADTYSWVTLPDDRAGLLTRAAFLTVYATATVTSPIQRGHWIREELLCDALADPPPNADDTPLEGGPDGGGNDVLTVREATEERTMTDPQCAGCHQLINPLGYTLEGFDAIGRKQVTEVVSGEPVDVEVEMTNTDFNGTINGAKELSEAIASSAKARNCFASHWYRRALGAEPPEACAGTDGTENFADTGDMRQLLSQMITSDAFRYVNIGD